MKIAIIGSGISGISAAFHLQNSHQVTILEKNTMIGGHTNSIEIIDDIGIKRNIDTGFIVFNNRNYPEFSTFLDIMNVPYQISDMSFSYTNILNNISYSGKFSGLFPSTKSLFSKHKWNFIYKIIRTSKKLQLNVSKYGANSMSIYEALLDLNCPKEIMDDYFLPMASAIWSSNEKSVAETPADTFLRFFSNHGLLSFRNKPKWYSILGGSRTYLNRFETQFKGIIKTDSEVIKINHKNKNIEVILKTQKNMIFDIVIIATHSDIAKTMSRDANPYKAQILEEYKYNKNRAVLHTDVSFLPNNKKIQASWNVIKNPESTKNGDHYEITYYMNKLQKIHSPNQYLVTLNPYKDPPESQILYETIYHHPVLNHSSQENWNNQRLLNNNGAIYYCGAYLGYGFHEDGYKSGKHVANLINQTKVSIS